MEKMHVGGSVVTFVNRGVRVNALVVQSEIVNILDKTVNLGIRQEEHLTVAYLKPELLQSRMGGADIDRAIGKEFGVLAVTEAPEDPNNLLRYALVGGTEEHSIYEHPVYDSSGSLPVALNPHPELVQYSPQHTVQIPTLRTRHNPGKIPVGSSYRVSDPDGYREQELANLPPGSIAEPTHNPEGPTDTAVDLSTDPAHVPGSDGVLGSQQVPAAPAGLTPPPLSKEEQDKAEWLRQEKEAKEHPDPAR